MSGSRRSRWYFGGLASCGAACCTHPLDLLKVHLQTQQEVKMRMTGMAVRVVQNDGILALYNGLSASLFRQWDLNLCPCSISSGLWVTSPLTFARDQHLLPLSLLLDLEWELYCGGGCGGGVWNSCVLAERPLSLHTPPRHKEPAEIGGHFGKVCNSSVPLFGRMQNDVKLPAALRSNYKHAVDGLYRVLQEEGIRKLFSGATMASSRGALVTVGQLACYDQAKQLVLNTGFLSDNIVAHFLSSFIAGGCATFLCQPLDVLKTRLMNSKGEYRGLWHCIIETARLGPLGFYKGLVPAGIRLVPHTVLTFVFLEQLRNRFGFLVQT
ncbi:mitochondrial dicarboxylate carrier [Stegostoma tigrinum]|uniref:mitochondrial dicarboxylate carrier n=1 Tax=Stegostoma tigrinum TaxID=3053191 RepID=UPI00286FB2CF|nr:mitochondrial dicarboxylate carrier [Stegostoma tigrinum]